MPYTDTPDQVSLPFSGSSVQARHASWTGATAAERSRRGKTQAYLVLLKLYGALSDQAVAALTGWPLSSVNSVRNGLAELVVPDGSYEVAHVGSKTTKRTRWRLKG